MYSARDSFRRVNGKGVLSYLFHRRNSYDDQQLRPLVDQTLTYEWKSVNGEMFLCPNGGTETDFTNLGFRAAPDRSSRIGSAAYLARIYCHKNDANDSLNYILMVTNGTGGYDFLIRSLDGSFQVHVKGWWFDGVTKTPGTIYTVCGWISGTEYGFFVNEQAATVNYDPFGSNTQRGQQVKVGDGWGYPTSNDFGTSLLWMGYGNYSESSLRAIARDPYRHLFRADEPFYTASAASGVPTLSAATVTNIQNTQVTPRVTVTF